jgi:hypothetical protein
MTTQLKEAHVITCNDSVQAVVLGSQERAERVMKFLKEKEKALLPVSDPRKTTYDSIFYWTVRTRPIIRRIK